MRVSSGKTTPSKVTAAIVFSSSTASASRAIIDCSALEVQAACTHTDTLSTVLISSSVVMDLIATKQCGFDSWLSMYLTHETQLFFNHIHWTINSHTLNIKCAYRI